MFYRATDGRRELMIEIHYCEKGAGLPYPVLLRHRTLDVAYRSAAAHLTVFAREIESAAERAVCDVKAGWNLKPAAESDLARRIRAATERYYMLPEAAASVANEIGYSTAYMRRIYYRETGERYHAYLKELRLRAAKRYLIFSSMPVGEVGRAVGFRNSQYFSEAFFHRFGIRPSEERKRNGQTGTDL